MLLVGGLLLPVLGSGRGAAAADASPFPTASVGPATLPVLPPDSLYAAGGPVVAGPAGEILAQVELAAPAGARTWAVVYRSSDAQGSPIGVSGLIIAPATAWTPGSAARTVLSIGHPTAGLADACAPSRLPSDGLVTTALPLLAQGFVLAVTDYEGLGTPGPHPYIVGQSEGRSVLDAALAAQALPDTGAGPTTVLMGGSQGGHAVLWAADLAATVAPSLDIVGTIAFAPAGDLAAIARFDQVGDPDPAARSSALMLVDAWHDSYGLSRGVLTPEGRAALPVLASACDVQLSAMPVDTDLTTRPAWLRRLHQNTPGQVRTDIPILIFQGDADRVVPIASTRSLVARLCAIGDTVDLRILAGADHRGSLSMASLLTAIGWAQDRLAGIPAASTCP